MTTDPNCPECKRLHGIYSDATVRYMRFHDGSRGLGEETDREGMRLLTEMKNAQRAIDAHLLGAHANTADVA